MCLLCQDCYAQEKREVRQFQFTAWPDHGVPDHPTPLLLFMRRVKSMTPANPDGGPLVIHCRCSSSVSTVIHRMIHHMYVRLSCVKCAGY